jgi:hypothetical protein
MLEIRVQAASETRATGANLRDNTYQGSFGYALLRTYPPGVLQLDASYTATIVAIHAYSQGTRCVGDACYRVSSSNITRQDSFGSAFLTTLQAHMS